tara:strand:- start:6 stop:290 length:285 start_codon:yes stop_codon:yes gene_type:complete
MEDFDKGAKRKCTQCSTLFFDFGKFPIVCPNCGADVNSLLTNVSKRGRPPKIAKVQKKEESSNVEIEDIDVPEDMEDVNSDDESVEEIIEIEKP